MVSIRTIAQKIGVSPATVSRVLSHDPTFSVSDQTRQLVEETAVALNYTKPDRYIKTIQIVSSQSRAMELDDPYFRTLRLAIEEAAQKRHLHLNPTIRIFATDTEISEATDLAVGGILVIGGFTHSALMHLQAVNPNLVVVDDATIPANMDGVYVDLLDFGTRLFTKVFEQAYGPVAYIGGQRTQRELDGQEITDEQESRYQAYQQVASKFDQPNLAQLGPWTSDFGEHQALWYLRQSPRPQTVILGNDPLAIGFIRGLMQGDLPTSAFPKMVSFDNTDMARYTTPTLTSVAFPLRLFGENAIRLLSERLYAQRSHASHVIFEPTVTYRESYPDILID